GALVMTGQVDQRPADLHSRQVPEVSGVLWHSRLKRPAEADQGSLQDVVGLFPAPDPGEPPEHLVGQVVEAVAGTSDEVVEGAAVAGAEVVKQMGYFSTGLAHARDLPRGELRHPVLVWPRAVKAGTCAGTLKRGSLKSTSHSAKVQTRRQIA